MIAAAFVIASETAGFTLSGWIGTLFADRYCARARPAAGGPLPTVLPRWFFPICTTVVGLTCVVHGAQPERLVVLAIVLFAMVACVSTDLRVGSIPNLPSFGALALVVGYALAGRNVGPIVAAAVVSVPFAMLAFVSRGHGIGWGDVAPAALGGALLGARDAMLVFALAALVAFLLSSRSCDPARPRAFCPYLVGSMIVALALEWSV